MDRNAITKLFRRARKLCAGQKRKDKVPEEKIKPSQSKADLEVESQKQIGECRDFADVVGENGSVYICRSEA